MLRKKRYLEDLFIGRPYSLFIVLIIKLALLGNFVIFLVGALANSFSFKSIQLLPYSLKAISQKNPGNLNVDHFLLNIFIVWLILIADVSLIFWSKKKEVFSKKPKKKHYYKKIKILTIGIGLALSFLSFYLWHIF